MSNFYLALVHYPVVNKNGELVTTSVTNLDIHDISRSCRTFGIKKYFIITPIKEQWNLIEKILDFWESSYAQKYNQDRNYALKCVSLKMSVKDAPTSAVCGESYNNYKHLEASRALQFRL